jgi:uncharacterized membrane protein
MSVISRLFWKGIIVVLPVTLSIYVLLVILNKAENLFGSMIKSVIGSSLYVPGLGIFVTFILMILVGILVSNFITGNIIKFFINQFEKVPLIKAVYNPLRDLMSLFGGSGPNNMKKVVVVNFEKMGIQSLGLVTREEFEDLPAGTFGPELIAVYIPMGYMIGGFTVLVNRDSVKEIDIPVEKAIKLAITGWIKADKNVI